MKDKERWRKEGTERERKTGRGGRWMIGGHRREREGRKRERETKKEKTEGEM